MTHKQILKRQYLEAPSRAGVFAIRNQITGRALVAASANAQGTLNRHHFELRHGQHRNTRLAQDWAEHGASSFVFEIVDMLKPSTDPAFDAAQELQTLLHLWLEEIPCQGEHGYGDAKKAAA